MGMLGARVEASKTTNSRNNRSKHVVLAAKQLLQSKSRKRLLSAAQGRTLMRKLLRQQASRAELEEQYREREDVLWTRVEVLEELVYGDKKVEAGLTNYAPGRAMSNVLEAVPEPEVVEMSLDVVEQEGQGADAALLAGENGLPLPLRMKAPSGLNKIGGSTEDSTTDDHASDHADPREQSSSSSSASSTMGGADGAEKTESVAEARDSNPPARSFLDEVSASTSGGVEQPRRQETLLSPSSQGVPASAAGRKRGEKKGARIDQRRRPLRVNMDAVLVPRFEYLRRPRGADRNHGAPAFCVSFLSAPGPAAPEQFPFGAGGATATETARHASTGPAGAQKVRCFPGEHDAPYSPHELLGSSPIGSPPPSPYTRGTSTFVGEDPYFSPAAPAPAAAPPPPPAHSVPSPMPAPSRPPPSPPQSASASLGPLTNADGSPLFTKNEDGSINLLPAILGAGRGSDGSADTTEGGPQVEEDMSISTERGRDVQQAATDALEAAAQEFLTVLHGKEAEIAQLRDEIQQLQLAETLWSSGAGLDAMRAGPGGGPHPLSHSGHHLPQELPPPGHHPGAPALLQHRSCPESPEQQHRHSQPAGHQDFYMPPCPSPELHMDRSFDAGGGQMVENENGFLNLPDLVGFEQHQNQNYGQLLETWPPVEQTDQLEQFGSLERVAGNSVVLDGTHGNPCSPAVYGRALRPNHGPPPPPPGPPSGTSDLGRQGYTNDGATSTGPPPSPEVHGRGMRASEVGGKSGSPPRGGAANQKGSSVSQTIGAASRNEESSAGAVAGGKRGIPQHVGVAPPGGPLQANFVSQPHQTSPNPRSRGRPLSGGRRKGAVGVSGSTSGSGTGGASPGIPDRRFGGAADESFVPDRNRHMSPIETSSGYRNPWTAQQPNPPSDRRFDHHAPSHAASGGSSQSISPSRSGAAAAAAREKKKLDTVDYRSFFSGKNDPMVIRKEKLQKVAAQMGIALSADGGNSSSSETMGHVGPAGGGGAAGPASGPAAPEIRQTAYERFAPVKGGRNSVGGGAAATASEMRRDPRQHPRDNTDREQQDPPVSLRSPNLQSRGEHQQHSHSYSTSASASPNLQSRGEQITVPAATSSPYDVFRNKPGGGNKFANRVISVQPPAPINRGSGGILGRGVPERQAGGLRQQPYDLLNAPPATSPTPGGGVSGHQPPPLPSSGGSGGNDVPPPPPPPEDEGSLYHDNKRADIYKALRGFAKKVARG